MMGQVSAAMVPNLHKARIIIIHNENKHTFHPCRLGCRTVITAAIYTLTGQTQFF